MMKMILVEYLVSNRDLSWNSFPSLLLKCDLPQGNICLENQNNISNQVLFMFSFHPAVSHYESIS